MKNNKARLFLTSLEVLIENTGTLRDKVNESIEQEDFFVDGDDLDSFDESVEIVLEARNGFCDENEMSTDDGSIKWTLSRVQKEENGAVE